MKKDFQGQLFRLAAVLYADNNYEVSPKTIYRKVIESVFLECGEREYSVHQIIDFIEAQYSIIFDEDTVRDVVSGHENTFLRNCRSGELFVCLSEKRKQTLQSKINNKTIDFFITEFQNKYAEHVDNIDSKVVLYKFLYEVFSTNISSFQKLIDNKKNLSDVINLENSSYSEEERKIINSFLQWENFEKNKAVFNIASYALEYCMLTNKSGKSLIHLDNLKSKSFYLDTNIIYRALGINGEDRQKRSRTFLRKFSDSGEKIVISKSTDTEFKETIRAHIDRIRRYDSPRVNSRVFQSVKVQHDIYSFYHKWRVGRVNYSLDLFIAEIYAIYDEFKKEFKIEVDVLKPFDVEDKNVSTVLKDYTSSILTFKRSEGNDIIGSATIDAENILWIEKKRDNKTQNIFDAKYFLISTDQALRRWDYQREDKTPIVLLPSQWMSILLRYLNRTEDDFKSFVSFLNLRNSEVLIDSESLHVVLAGIAEMTTNIEQQHAILNNLLANKFNGIVSQHTTTEQIFENAKRIAKSKLENEVKALKLENDSLLKMQEKLYADMAKCQTAIADDLQRPNDREREADKEVDKKELENLKLREKLLEKEMKEEFRKWQLPAKWSIVLAVLIIVFTVLQFCCQSCRHNFPYHIVELIDGIKSDTLKGTLRGLMYAPILGLWSIAKIVWNRLISKEEKEKKMRAIKEKLNRELYQQIG